MFEKMHFIKKLLVALFLLGGSFPVFSQVDTAFWFAVPKLAHTHQHWPIVLVVSNTEPQQATVTVTKANSGQQVGTPLTVPANGSATMTLVSNEAGLTGFECEYNTTSPFGLYIHSNRKINAYVALQENNSEIYALKGESGLGTHFFVPMQFKYNTGTGNQSDGYYGTCRNAVEIIATENATTVHITPSVQCGNHSANQEFTVTLQKGQVYCLASNSQAPTGHLFGTIITADKPIVVDASDDSVNPGNGSSNYDLVADQLVPEELAGNEYVVIPSPSGVSNSTVGGGLSDYAFIFALEDYTDIDIYYEGNNGLETKHYTNRMRGDTVSFHFPNNNPAYIYSYHMDANTGNMDPKKIIVFQLTGAGNELGGTQLPFINCTGSQNVTYRPLAHPSNYQKSLFFILICEQGAINGFQIQTSMGNIQINNNEWHNVPGSGILKYCRKNISSYATSSYINISNSQSRFHLGMIDFNDAGTQYSDCSISYFSNYASESSIKWDTTITHSDYCQGETIYLDFDSIDVNISRVMGPNYDEPTGPFLINDAVQSNSGTYYVYALDARCPSSILLDSIEITVHPTVESVMYDTICPGASYFQNGFQISGDTTAIPRTIVDTVITQTFEFGCDSLLILNLKIRDSVLSEFSKKACNNYMWEGQIYTSSNDYKRTFTDVNGCDSIVTLHLEIEEPKVEIIPSSDDFCEFGEMVLTAESDYNSYRWSTGDTTAFISVTQPGLYTVTAIQGDCQATDKFETPDCPLNIFIPSGITPSLQDGLNDYLYIPEYVHRFIKEIDLEIYNRWGELIYKTNDMNFRWYGNIDGKGEGTRAQVSNVYIYILHYLPNNGKDEKWRVKKGTVTVL